MILNLKDVNNNISFLNYSLFKFFLNSKFFFLKSNNLTFLNVNNFFLSKLSKKLIFFIVVELLILNKNFLFLKIHFKTYKYFFKKQSLSYKKVLDFNTFLFTINKPDFSKYTIKNYIFTKNIKFKFYINLKKKINLYLNCKVWDTKLLNGSIKIKPTLNLVLLTKTSSFYISFLNSKVFLWSELPFLYSLSQYDVEYLSNNSDENILNLFLLKFFSNNYLNFLPRKLKKPICSFFLSLKPLYNYNFIFHTNSFKVNLLFFSSFSYSKNFILKFSSNKIIKENKKINVLKFISYFLFYRDFNLFFENNLKQQLPFDFFLNKITINFSSLVDENTDLNKIFTINKKNLFNNFNNFYPVISLNSRLSKIFFDEFKSIYNNSYSNLVNKLILSFLESFLKKHVYIKVGNNSINKINNILFLNLCENYKGFKPLYFKNFLFKDFLEILWYSFYYKDLTMMSEWISTFMETLKFKNHKKFVMFFNNFMIKNYELFQNVLKIKGFFFDIRGKVGVTGSSKKRHICFKFGCLKKSSKKFKIDFNQTLVRSYSGVMGLTFIISY